MAAVFGAIENYNPNNNESANGIIEDVKKRSMLLTVIWIEIYH